MAADLEVTLGRINLTSPLILGSFDALVDAEVLARCFKECGRALGAVVTKSTTLDPRVGYPQPRVSRFGEGLLVASGNRNPGIVRMASEVRRVKQGPGGTVVFGSIVSDPDHPDRNLLEEYSLLAVEYAKAGADGVELNLSCPHLDPHDRQNTIVPAQDPEIVGQVVTATRTRLAQSGYEAFVVIPKLTGWNCDPVKVALAAEQAGADAVTISNLFPGTGYHTGIGEPLQTSVRRIGENLLGHGKGGYSGKAMHAPVLLMISNLRRQLRIPVIGTGGCASDLDSLVQTFMAGATAVAAVTPFYFESKQQMGALQRVIELVEQFKAYLGNNGLRSPADLYELRRAAAGA